MNAQNNEELNRLLSETLTNETNDFEVPQLSQKARHVIMARKQAKVPDAGFFDSLFAFIRFELRFFHVGLTVLILSTGVFYLSDTNYDAGNGSGFSSYNNDLSIANNTISVNSSTMLTSIPTLVIRN